MTMSMLGLLLLAWAAVGSARPPLSVARRYAAYPPRRRRGVALRARAPRAATTDALAAVTVGAYAVQALRPELAALGARSAPLIARGQWWRLLTPLFLHASPSHLLVNVLSLRNVGGALERSHGAERTALVYAAAGVAGNVLSCARSPRRVTSLGASGAVAGLIGALAVHLYRHRSIYGTRGLESIRNTVLLNAALGATAGNVDNWAHLGGLVGGAAAGVAFGCRWRPRYDALGGVCGIVDRPLIRL